MVLKESSAYDPSSPNRPPPSLGPGARRLDSSNPPSDPRAVLREVDEIRSHYSLQVTDSALEIAYRIHNAHRQYSLPFSALPLGSLSRWILYGGPGRSMVTGLFVIDIIRGSENMAGRQLTQQEAEGFAMHGSKKMLYNYISSVGAVATGYAVAYTGRKVMKFPFRRPKPLERYDSFPSRYLPILRGGFAQTMWQITRANMYAMLALLFVQPVFSAMSDTSLTVGLYRDPRTKDVTMEIRNRGPLNRIQSNRQRADPGAGQRPLSQQPTQTQNSQSSQYEGSQSEDYLADTRPDVANGYSGGQNYTSGEAGDTAYTNDTTDTNVMDDTSMRQHETKQTSPSVFPGFGRRRQQQPPQQPRQQQQQQSSGSGSDFFFGGGDDASPTAGADPLDPTRAPQSQPSNGRGSAWNRVRHGESTGRQSPPPQPPDGGSETRPTGGGVWGGMRRSKGDDETKGAESFSFANSDQEKALAREMAQREFDELIERERKGSADMGGASNAQSGFANYEDGAGGGSGGQGQGGSAWDRWRRK